MTRKNKILVAAAMITILGLLFMWIYGQAKVPSANQMGEFAGKWESAFYNMDPPSYLNIFADGTYEYQKHRGRWSSRGKGITLFSFVFSNKYPAQDLDLGLEQDGRMLSDHIADGASFVRVSPAKTSR